jgi:hypothetical protein
VRAAAAGTAAVALSLVALTGCAHHSTGASPPAAATGGMTQQQAAKALLTQAELPLGFEQQDGGGDATAIGCAGIDRLYLSQDTTARASVSFGHTLSSAFVNETIAVQPGKATANVDGFRRAAQDCRAFSGSGQQYQVTPLTGLPAYGDATAGLRITSQLREARPVELVAVRIGDTVVLVANAEAGAVDTELTRTIVARAVQKLRKSG